jgi:catalase
MSDSQIPRTTTDAGIPAASDEHSLTVGADGPILLQDHYLIQKMAQFNRERVPERVVHAKGGGAHGFFEVTEDVSQYCKADFLSTVGKKTPLFIRISTVAGELGSADTVRDPRGFAIKFYTPIFFVRDPSKFSDFIHSQKRMPDTNLRSNDAQWDFWTLSPESAHQVSFLMSDRGTPRSWRHMNGYGSHTFLWENAGGDKFWVKYHFKTVQGAENFTDAEAKAMVAEEPDFHIRDLHDAIAQGDAPEWRLEMQIMPFADAADYRFNPFDLTKVWPHGDYPPIQVGRMVLDRNPEHYFAEVEQSAFEPANLVRGIGPSPDKMLLGRLFSYPDTHRYRIGPNYLQLPINQPKSPVNSYNKDGAMRYHHHGSTPVYAPNSYGGPKADAGFAETTWGVEGADMIRHAYTLHSEDDDFGQPGTLVRQTLSSTDVDHLAENIIGHATNAVTPEIQKRVIEYWTNVDSDLGAKVAHGISGASSNGAGAHNAPHGEAPVGSSASTGL